MKKRKLLPPITLLQPEHYPLIAIFLDYSDLYTFLLISRHITLTETFFKRVCIRNFGDYFILEVLTKNFLKKFYKGKYRILYFHRHKSILNHFNLIYNYSFGDDVGIEAFERNENLNIAAYVVKMVELVNEMEAGKITNLANVFMYVDSVVFKLCMMDNKEVYYYLYTYDNEGVSYGNVFCPGSTKPMYKIVEDKFYIEDNIMRKKKLLKECLNRYFFQKEVEYTFVEKTKEDDIPFYEMDEYGNSLSSGEEGERNGDIRRSDEDDDDDEEEGESDHGFRESLEQFNQQLKALQSPKHPNDYQFYIRQGQKKYEESKFEEAIKQFEDMFEKISIDNIPNESRFEGYLIRAAAWYGLKNYDNALIDSDKAMELFQENEILHNIRGHCFYYKDDYANAIKEFDYVVDMNGQHYEGLHFRGLCRTKMGKFHEAVFDFEKTIFLSKDYESSIHIQSVFYKAHCLKCLNEFERAKVAYDDYIALCPDDIEAYMERASCLTACEKYSESLKELEQCLEKSGDDAAFERSVHINKGFCFMKLYQYKKAVDEFTLSINLLQNIDDDDVIPYESEVWFWRAQCHLQLQMIKESMYDIEMCRPSKAANVLFFLGVIHHCLLENDNTQKAIHYYTEAISVDKQFSPAYRNRGRLYLELKQFEKAYEDLSVAVKIDQLCGAGSISGALYLKAIVLFHMGRDDEASDIFKNNKCEFSYYWYYKGIYFKEKREWAQSLSCFQRCLQILNSNNKNKFMSIYWHEKLKLEVELKYVLGMIKPNTTINASIATNT